MRALGITRFGMILLYAYEAFVLVFSSSFSGLAIGNKNTNLYILNRSNSWIYNDNATCIIHLTAYNICIPNPKLFNNFINEYICSDFKYYNSCLFNT